LCLSPNGKHSVAETPYRKDRWMNVKFMIMGRSYDSADALPDQLMLADDARIGEALQQVTRLLPAGQGLPDSGLLVVSGKHLGTIASHQDHPLRDGDELVIIAPVAGG